MSCNNVSQDIRNTHTQGETEDEISLDTFHNIDAIAGGDETRTTATTTTFAAAAAAVAICKKALELRNTYRCVWFNILKRMIDVDRCIYITSN